MNEIDRIRKSFFRLRGFLPSRAEIKETVKILSEMAQLNDKNIRAIENFNKLSKAK